MQNNGKLTAVSGIGHVGEDCFRSVEQREEEMIFPIGVRPWHRGPVYLPVAFQCTCARYRSQQQQKTADGP